jgi:GAF domain-containing protein
VCAEGIEDLQDLRVLADLDVTYGQGYALGRPAPDRAPLQADAVAVLLDAHDVALRAPTACRVGDRELELAGARLAGAASLDDIEGIMPAVARAIGAAEVHVSTLNPADRSIVTLCACAQFPRGEQFPVDEFPLTARVLDRHEAAQVLADDPAADPAEVAVMREVGDFGALLLVPVVARGVSVGLLEAYGTRSQPWTRHQVVRARLFAHQLGALLWTLEERGLAAA